MADNRQWLDAGLQTLEEFGAPGLTIERLMERVGLTKGSFYHHFGGMAGFKTALLSHYEAKFTTLFIDMVEQRPDTGARIKLEWLLLDLVCAEEHGADIEIALRAWALQDAEVGRAQERVDRIRVDYLRGLWLELSGDADQAAHVGDLLYLILIGAGQLRPPLLAVELRGLYQFVLGLLPSTGHRSRPARTRRAKVRSR